MPRSLYGWKRDRPSPRDWPAHPLLSVLPPPPAAASLRDRAGGKAAVLDQVRSDCVANSVAKVVQVALSTASVLSPLPSRNWIYYQAGCIEGSQKDDNGRYIRDALDALGMVGWPDETDWPYDARWNVPAGAAVHRLAFDQAQAINVGRYRIDAPPGPARRDQVSRAISGGFPVVGGGDITQAWEDQGGKSPLPWDPTAPPVGGHAYTLLEYDPGGLHPLNSWGPDGFGIDGWGYLSWDWLDHLDDLWAVSMGPSARQGVV